MATIVTGDQYEKLDGKLFEIKRQLRQKGGYPYDLSQLDAALQAIIEGRFKTIVCAEKKVAGAFTAFVDYIVPSPEELESAFDDVSGYFNEVESIEVCQAVSREPREIAFEVIYIGRDISTDEALFELEENGHRPALFEELMAFAKAYPDEQRKHPIIALGSVYVDLGGYDNAAILSGCSTRRSLRAHGLERGCGIHCYFLTVRK